MAISSNVNPTVSTNDIVNTLSVTDTPRSSIPSLTISSSASPSLGNLSPGSMDLFSDSNVLGSLKSSSAMLTSKPSITIPASIPATTKTPSVTLPKTYSSLKDTSSQSKKDEDTLHSSLLKSALFNNSIVSTTAKASSTPTTPKLKSLSLNNSPRLHSPRISSPRAGSRPSTPRSAQSSPSLGMNRTPTKYKNITPKPVKSKSAFDLTTLSQLNNFNQYLNFLSTMNPAQNNNLVSLAGLNNPLVDGLLPLGTPPDPSSLLYYQSLNSLASGNSLFTNPNLSQLAVPPPIPPLCDPSILSALQTTQSSTSNPSIAPSLNTYLGNDLANSFALALGASAPPTTTNSDSSKTLADISSNINSSSLTSTPVGELAKSMSTPILTPNLNDLSSSAFMSSPLNGSNLGIFEREFYKASSNATALLNSLNLNIAANSSANGANIASSLNVPITIDDNGNSSKTNTISDSTRSSPS